MQLCSLIRVGDGEEKKHAKAAACSGTSEAKLLWILALVILKGAWSSAFQNQGF